MGTPERRRDAVVDIGRSQPTYEPTRVEPTRDVGWLISVASAVGTLIGSWTLFPTDADGMWAGYWVTGMVTVSLLGSMWLRSTLPVGLGVAIAAAPGAVLVLLGALRDYPATISAVMVGGGVGMLLGGLLQARDHR